MADTTPRPLREWRKLNRWTQEEMAEKVGISRSYYANLEAELQNAPVHIMKVLRDLGFDPTKDPQPSSEGRIVSIAGTPMVAIPVIGSASAGPGIYNVDPDTDKVFVPERLGNLNGTGWVVDGESMMPALQPGDVALFREFREPRRGLPFLIKCHTGEYRVKILEYEQGWVLRSLNPVFQTEPMHQGDELIGFLIGWYRAKGSRETLDSDPSGLRLDPRDYFL